MDSGTKVCGPMESSDYSYCSIPVVAWTRCSCAGSPAVPV